MAESPRTKGEIVFEDYLNFQGIPFGFEKEHPGKTKRPDYTIEWGGKTIVLDVKDFDPPDTPLSGFGAFDPYPPIREKIDQGRGKFKQIKGDITSTTHTKRASALRYRNNTSTMLSHSASSGSRQTGLPARPYQYAALP